MTKEEANKRARDISEWAIDKKLVPIIDRCTEMIAKELLLADQEANEKCAKIAEKYEICSMGWSGEIPKDATQHKVFEERMLCTIQHYKSGLEIGKIIRSQSEKEKHEAKRKNQRDL